MGKGRYLSQYDSGTNKIDIFIGKDGQQTYQYPHVHVVHNENNGRVEIMAHPTKHEETYKKVLTNSPSGQEVDRYIEKAIEYL